MKKIAITGALLCAVLSVTSCREEFLQKEPTEKLSVVPAQEKLNGLYLMMANTGTGGTTAHDDFGVKGYDIYSDLLSSDMVLGGVTYRWYSGIADLTSTVDVSDVVNYKPWRFYYRLIAGANDVIKELGGNDANPTSENERYGLGQAKALRAFAYYNLLNLYTSAEYDSSKKAIPIYKEPTAQGGSRASQKEVYDFIVADLEDAVLKLEGFSRQNKGIINKNVAQGLLAYAYSGVGRYSESAQLAEQLIATHPATSREQVVYNLTTQKGGGFNEISTPSWMWGFDIQIVNDLDLVSWWGQADVFTYSYSYVGDYKAIDLGLYNSMRADDIRRDQFKTIIANSNGVVTAYKDASDTAGHYLAVPVNKFFDPARKVGGQRVVTTDYLYMRVDEFHLLAAENYAKAGNEAKAKEILKNFLSNRVSDTSYVDALSGNALKNEIYLQTRIELWGEGKSYFAMKRNKATITRGSNHLFYSGTSFSYDDNKLTFKIPQSESLNNPNL